MHLRNLFFLLCFVALFTGCFEGIKSGPSLPTFDITKVVFDERTYPVVVLGGGSAGLTAANYLAQAEIPCIVIEGDKPGGALAQSDSVRNWPGVFNQPGLAITNAFKEQAVKNGVPVTQEKAVAFDVHQWPYVLEVENLASGEKRIIRALSCIIATGAEPNYLNVPGERGQGGYWGHGVSNCAICDGSLFSGKKVVVIGGGDSALLEASYLSGIANQVTILVRKSELKARDKRKVSETLARSNVSIVYDTEVTKILGDESKVEHIEVHNIKTGEMGIMPIDGVFLATGSRPNTDLFKGQIALNDQGFILLSKGRETSQKGVFAAGDVCDSTRQAVTAASDGCNAALEAQNFLDDLGYDAKKVVQEKKREQPVEKITEQVVEKSEPLRTNKAEKNKVEPLENNLIEISSLNHFEQLFKEHSDKQIVIDFYAVWCGPCRMMIPILHDLAEQFKQILFLKIDVDRVNPHAILEYVGGGAVMGVPAFAFIYQGKKVGRLVTGAMNKAVFVQKIKEAFQLI